ncbi:MAG TPA: hypothetical protein VI489_01190, partial [Candidatus Brocadiaceae bacterium]
RSTGADTMKRSYLAAVACLVGVTISGLGAQQLDDRVIPNAPFSADATTTVTQTLGDGTKIEHVLIATPR